MQIVRNLTARRRLLNGDVLIEQVLLKRTFFPDMLECGDPFRDYDCIIDSNPGLDRWP